MDHPLLRKDQLDLRQRMVQLLREGYSAVGADNIIFVCGGNDPRGMRFKFRAYCEKNYRKLVIFFPEFAIKNQLSDTGYGPLNLAEFETIVGQLSHAIVLFPEAPGSYAEAGYFSAIKSLASKTILALDIQYQGKDSFISMGPAKLFDRNSEFGGVFHISYNRPPFKQIVQRIGRINSAGKRRTISLTNVFKENTYIDLFFSTINMVRIFQIATAKDIEFLYTSMFRNQLSKNLIHQLLSIAVGAKYLRPVGRYGHYALTPAADKLTSVMSSFGARERALRLEAAPVILGGATEFRRIIEEATRAD